MASLAFKFEEITARELKPELYELDGISRATIEAHWTFFPLWYIEPQLARRDATRRETAARRETKWRPTRELARGGTGIIAAHPSKSLAARHPATGQSPTCARSDRRCGR